MAYIKDEQRIRRDNYFKSVERYRERLKQWVAQQMQNVVYLEDNSLLTNEAHQLGKPMTSHDLEIRLVKICPNLVFRVNPFNEQMKALYIQRNGIPEYICAYHNGYMPERSVIKVKEREIWDPNQTHIDRKDLPKHEWKGAGKGFVFDDTVTKPGFKKVKEPWGEAKRGWRTVLLKLVAANILSPAIIEKYFGADNTAAWQSHTGKKGIFVPW